MSKKPSSRLAFTDKLKAHILSAVILSSEKCLLLRVGIGGVSATTQVACAWQNDCNVERRKACHRCGPLLSCVWTDPSIDHAMELEPSRCDGGEGRVCKEIGREGALQPFLTSSDVNHGDKHSRLADRGLDMIRFSQRGVQGGCFLGTSETDGSL